MPSDRFGMDSSEQRAAQEAEAAAHAAIPRSSPLEMMYVNHRGEAALRRIVPVMVWHGATEWHKEPQWLLRAWDVDRQATRDFAMRDIGEDRWVNPSDQVVWTRPTAEAYARACLALQLEKNARIAEARFIGARLLDPSFLSWLPLDTAPCSPPTADRRQRILLWYPGHGAARGYCYRDSRGVVQASSSEVRGLVPTHWRPELTGPDGEVVE